MRKELTTSTVNHKLLPFLVMIGLASACYSQHIEEFYRSPDSKDSLLAQEYDNLRPSERNVDNFSDYYSTAQALWQVKRNNEAKEMFIAILESDQELYTNTYYHSSDIPGDTTKNIYGYGSFTSNYKNSVCLYLAKIYIEEHNFAEALNYVTAAENEYVVYYNCGTGHNSYQGRLRTLYGLSYEGMGETEKAIELLLPYCFDWDNKIIIRIFKSQHSKVEIKKSMEVAVASITCVPDTFESTTISTTNYGKNNEEKIEWNYISGRGTIQLFGRTIKLNAPRLKNGETITKQHFIDDFLDSHFYQSLTGDYSHSSWNVDLKLDWKK